MYVPKEYQMNTDNEVAAMVSKFDKDEPKWYHILMIDYFYHNHEENYDNGLSFLDRLNKKIGQFHNDWDIEDFKILIKTANNPNSMYLDIVEYMLSNTNELAYYGI